MTNPPLTESGPTAVVDIATGGAGPVQDPTKNVLQVLSSAVTRLDDLASLRQQRSDDLMDAHRRHTDEVMALSQKRQDDLRDAEGRHLNVLMATTSRFEELLRLAETKRIDAIRTVDVNAVAEAARVSAAQALTLANQVQLSAETLRTQVAAVAQATAAALSNALEPLQKSIEDLRKTQYEQQGQKAASMDQRSERREDRGSSQWVIGLIVTVVIFLLGTFVTIAVVVVHSLQ